LQPIITLLRHDAALPAVRARGHFVRQKLPRCYSWSSLTFVRGPVTGWVYRFSPAEPVQAIDGRDLPALLASPHFKVSR
jgi:hypothetical protein